MTLVSELVPFLVLGLLGALHCSAMCGGFAIAVGSHGSGRAWPRLLVYAAGKASTYAIVALIISLSSNRLATELRSHRVVFDLHVPSPTTLVGILAGLTLVLMGYRRLSLLRTRASLPRITRLASRISAGANRLVAGARALPGASGTYSIGVLNGLLPCGLAWGAWILASQVEPPAAFAGGFLFGLGTTPALLAVGLAARALPAFGRRFANPLLGGALLTFGILTLFRTWRDAQATATSGPGEPGCCTSSPLQTTVGPALLEQTFADGHPRKIGR